MGVHSLADYEAPAPIEPDAAESAPAAAAEDARVEGDEFAFSFAAEGAVLAEFVLGRGEYVIGSAESSDISVDLEGIAPAHSRLHLDDEVFVEDLQAGAGTFVNGERVEGRRRLAVHETIGFGSSTGTLVLQSAPAPRLPPAAVQTKLASAPTEPTSVPTDPASALPEPTKALAAPAEPVTTPLPPKSGSKRKSKKEQKRGKGSRTSKEPAPTPAPPAALQKDEPRHSSNRPEIEQQLSAIRKEQDAALAFFSNERKAWQAHESAMRERLLELSLAVEASQHRTKNRPQPKKPPRWNQPPPRRLRPRIRAT
jgi:pSer/pThr/pTyr-binding forkhead associated (FHA) protein